MTRMGTHCSFSLMLWWDISAWVKMPHLLIFCLLNEFNHMKRTSWTIIIVYSWHNNEVKYISHLSTCSFLNLSFWVVIWILLEQRKKNLCGKIKYQEQFLATYWTDIFFFYPFGSESKIIFEQERYSVYFHNYFTMTLYAKKSSDWGYFESNNRFDYSSFSTFCLCWSALLKEPGVKISNLQSNLSSWFWIQ